LVVKYPTLGKIIPQAIKIATKVDENKNKVLGLITKVDNYSFNVAVESNFQSDLNVDGVATLASANVTDAFDVTGTFQIDSATVTSSATELNYLDDLTLAAGGVVYSTATGLSISAAGSADQVLTSAGTSVPTWKSASDLDVGTIGGIAGDSFLRSDTSDSFTSGVLDFSDGTLFDLSAILHNDSGVQGLKLPQYTSLTAISTGEGFLAYDTDDNALQVFNGTTWTSVGGVAGAGTAGQVTFWTDTDTISSDSGFLYDSATDILSIGSGGAVNPTVNLGSDLGSSSLRWNNLYVGTINTNATLDITGQALFTYDPADTTYTEASVLINPTSPETNEWMWATGDGGYQKAGIDVEGDLTLGYNDAVSAPNNANPLSIYNHGSSEIFSVDTTGNTIIAGDVTVTGGEILFNPIASAAVTTTSEGNVYYDSTIDHLMVYGSDAAFHRIAMDMTQYSASDASVSNQSYVEIAHGQTTNDLSITGWVYDSITSLWTQIKDQLASFDHDLQEEFNPDHTKEKKVTSVELDYRENDLGDGGDGAITITTNTNINDDDSISGRSCTTDGGDAVKYTVSSLTDNTATLTATPNSGCLSTLDGDGYADEVLLINLYGTSSAYGNVGNWETLRIKSISGSTITFTTNKTRYYGDATDADDSNINVNQFVILQRVPNYTNVTVDASSGTANFTPDEWVDSTSTANMGGVMFFRATGTVTVAADGVIHTNDMGYIGGTGSTLYNVSSDGGEAFCNVDGGGDGGHQTSRNGSNGLCGGGGGAGVNDANLGTGGTGTASAGGAGGGGGSAYDGTGSHGAGGGAGGYGTAGAAGTGQANGVNGGTNTSGDGGDSIQTDGNGGGGGGGGTYGDSGLNDLFLGSAGAGGGAPSHAPSTGGAGGDGGGIVYIAADTISVSGGLSADGENGTNPSNQTWDGGGGGGGGGGSVKLIGNTISLGSSITTADGGAGGDGGVVYAGGLGGDGRIAIYASDTPTGTTSPTYDSNALEYNTYSIYTSEEIHAPGATSYGNISWTESLDTNGDVNIQTRSGSTTDSTDTTWEGWKPSTITTNYVDLDNMDTPGNWTESDLDVPTDGDVVRNLNYFEDEDLDTADVGDSTMFGSVGANYGYVEATPSSTDLTGFDLISAWVYATSAGNVVKFGFGETAATEEEETITIDAMNTWQKVYWDLSDLDSSSCTGADGCNAVDNFRISLTQTNSTVYVDDIKAEKSLLSTPAGTAITSTAADYIQYRVILSTTDTANKPSVSDVQLAYANPNGTYTIDADRVRTIGDTDYYQNARNNITEVSLDDIKSARTLEGLTNVNLSGDYNLGTGADGAITVSSDTNINDIDLISGRSCADGGDAIHYTVESLTSTTATLSTTPSLGCLNVGDEILLINLFGTSSAYGNVGNNETLRIESIAADVVTFTTAKTKFYGDVTDADDTGLNSTQHVMLQRVPNYTDVTITTSGTDFIPDAWGGTTSYGGVMFFRATGTVGIASGTTINTNALGYRGGTGAANYNVSSDGGEAFCNVDGGGDSGRQTSRNGSNGLCGGGGGAGVNDASTGTGGTGSASAGGAGGGGGSAYDGTGSHGAGGGAGGYGTAGARGTGQANGVNGGTNTSGGGGTTVADGNGGGGGGGGTYGDSGLNDLFFGSAGGGGGSGYTIQAGGAGGDGGGIVYIAADTISVSGGLSADGENSTAGGNDTWDGGDGGGGAGGSLKLVGRTLILGSSLTTADGGAGDVGGATYAGGLGGDGRIAINYLDSFTGTVSPSAEEASVPNYPYSVYISDEIATPNAVELNNVHWNADLNGYGMVQVQTRSGKSNNSTDGSWEDWKPDVTDTNLKVLANMDDETSGNNWTESDLETAVDGDVARNVNYFEDEDLDTADVADATKFESIGADYGYADTTIGSADLSSYDFISAWVYATGSGNVVKLGFGESAGDEQEEIINVDASNTWQKVYWDITDIDPLDRNAVTELRINILSTNMTVYVDTFAAETLLSDSTGSIISSIPNEYIQYRVLMTTTDNGYKPTLYSIQAEWNNGYKIEQTDSDTVRLYNYTGDTQNLRLDIVVYGADLAEWYTVDDQSIMEGDLVSTTGELDQYGVPILTKATEENKNALVGAISTKAGQELGIPGEDRRLLALAGRIPVKIVSDSSEIKAGDFLGASEEEGKAEKLETGGITIGRALESWTPESGKETIKVMVGTSLYSPNSLLSNTGNVQIIKNLTEQEDGFDNDEFILAKSADAEEKPINPDPIYSLLNESGDQISGIAGVFSEATIANLKAGRVEADEIMVNGSPLSEYISQNLSGESSDASSEADLVLSNIESRLTLLEGENILGENNTNSSDSTVDYSTLTILGKSTLSDTVVNGILDVGILSINNLNGSINSIGPLSLQPLSLDSIHLQGKLIEMDIQGNIIIKEGQIIGNETFRGSAMLSSGQQSLVVEQNWSSPPSSILVNTTYYANTKISNLSESGFTVELDKASGKEEMVYWLAVW